MVLSFKKQFAEPILNGQKIHTIRQDQHHRWSNGKHIHMATGVRTKNYHCFNETVCTGIEYIFMTWSNSRGLEISIGQDELCDTYLYSYDLKKLAYNDGFESLEAFENWFIEAIKSQPNGQDYFSGKIIHWTDFRYC